MGRKTRDTGGARGCRLEFRLCSAISVARESKKEKEIETGERVEKLAVCGGFFGLFQKNFKIFFVFAS